MTGKKHEAKRPPVRRAAGSVKGGESSGERAWGDLREQAEKIARKKTVPAGGPSPAGLIGADFSGISEDMQRTLHELRVHQIELDLQNEELRRAEVALEALRARYFDLYDLAPVGYIVLNERGLILEANLTVAALLGVERGTLIKKPLTRYILPEDQDIYYRHRKSLFETGEPQVCVLRMACKTGSFFWARVEAAAAPTADGATRVCRAVISDITEVKRGEERLRHSEEFLESVIDHSPIAMWLSDETGTLLKLNQACRDLLHIAEEEVVGKYNLLRDDIVERQGFMPLVRGVFERGETAKFILEYRTPDLRQLPLRRDASVVLDVTISPVKDGRGRVTNAVIQHVDITARRRMESEREDAVRSLRKSEERYRALVMVSPDPIYVHVDGFVTLANPAMARLLGADDPSQLLGKSVFDLVDPEFHEVVRDRWRRISDGGTVPLLEEKFVRLDGSRVDVEATAVALPLTGPREIQVIARDITERKRAEEDLRESEERYKALFDRSRDLVYIHDFEGRFIDANDAALHRLGFTREEIRTLRFSSLLSDDQLPLAFKTIQEIRETGVQKELTEFRLRLQSGEIVSVETQGSVILSKGTPIAIQSIARDITERKRAEALLRASARRLTLALDSAKAGAWEWDVATGAIEWSPQMFDLFGLDPEKTAASFAVWRTRLHPEDAAFAERRIDEALKRRTILNSDYRVVLPDGRIRWINAVGEGVYDGQGRPVRMIGICQDITERKGAEERLRDSEAEYRNLFEDSVVGISQALPDGRLVRANMTYARMYGFANPEETIAEIRNVGAQLYAHPEERAEVLRILSEKGVMEPREFLVLRRDGTRFSVVVGANAVKDSKGNLRYFQASHLDISERKRTEAALQASETRYRLLVENANEAILVAQDGLLKFVNRTAVEMTGFTAMELLSQPFSEFVLPEDREMVVDHYRKRLAGETDLPRYEFRIRTRGGAVKWVEIGAVLIDWEGCPATLNFLSDITDRHQAEEAIQASLREKEVMLREIHHRVKNNMQVISSLFNLQSGHTLNQECRDILKEGQTRIRAMSLVHEKLYHSRDLSKIDLAAYIQSLAVHLFHVYVVDPDQVRLETDFGEVALDINSAVPCGLILNELISNSLKHAFPGGRKGLIRIGLKRGADDMVVLRVADDGIGFPPDVDFRQADSFGLQIVNLLVGQLEAAFDLDRTEGTAFTVTFRELKYAPRI